MFLGINKAWMLKRPGTIPGALNLPMSWFTIDSSLLFRDTKKLQKLFLVKYKTYSLKKANLIVVLGGDGFMLKTIKKHYRFKKPFYGINCGLVGFLMNKYAST